MTKDGAAGCVVQQAVTTALSLTTKPLSAGLLQPPRATL